ncbi:MAG: hypothetical protein EU540_07755 [Promethearchaeota archaeon]|nr:MAG: hypothetical protein EU540_07755 [Candidatus Lokiarchaeota archaeon]
MKKSPDIPTLDENAEMTLIFYLLTKNMDIEKEKFLSFSRLLWPLLSIQGVISTHLIIDGINIFSKKGKFSNPPRQPLIGHILRNTDEILKTEILNRIINVLTYKDAEAEEIGSGEESEYHTLNIEGLLNPEHLQSLLKLIPHLEYLPITDYVPLDTTLTTDNALDESEKYRSYVDTMKGNSHRWKTQIKLIEAEIEKWIINLNVEIKDVEMLYSSQISKASEIIDEEQMKKQKEIEFDKIEQWNVNEKKNIIENISVIFKTIEREIQEIIKKNRFFTDEERFKSKVFEDMLNTYENHFNYLKEETNNFLESIDLHHQRFNELKEKAPEIDSDTAVKLNNITMELNNKLQDRNKQLSDYKKEKEEKLAELTSLKKNYEDLLKKIKEICHDKIKICLQEAQDLTEWSIQDTNDDLFSKPIQWIYLPFYAMFIENEELMEERMDVVFPGYVNNNPDSPYEDISDSFIEFKNLVKEKVQEDIKIRSNFEFSSEKKNLIKDPNFKSKIQQGISILKEKGMFNSEIEAKIIKLLP